MDSERTASPAVARTLTVLETLVGSEEELTLTALAKKADIPLATCAAIVYTLELRDYATRRIVGRSHFWRPTLRLYGLATQLVRKVDLSTIAQQEMRDLADQLSLPVHLGVLTGTSVVYVAKAALPGFIQFDTYPGKVAPYNLTALGKAIAAYLPEEGLLPLLAHLSSGHGPRAQEATEAAFRQELLTVRKRGYAVEDQEEQADIACLAAPFFDGTDQVAGAVGVTGFAKDLRGKKRDAAQIGLRRLAGTISQRLGAPVS
ncbi:IclR family transcriptional regulator [Kribbella sandramycini]|uniref:IclR family transcriptional regulator n=1 Tax=Kribbella sandramycini TaxID=60450 RepID=A0A7Y4P549_9ACTN|nr:IclR family transcriptional regulator [Kribbella sandramycini]MBB6570282.1 DNA-binding IclR family transcriptional regulator [Kribbella sandramycini]NOL45800.1 IclR family transcriptional regulator [Kribbella sandramycini]